MAFLRRLLAICLLLVAPLAADEILLKSGGRLSGEVLEEREETILIRLPNGTMEIDRARIESVRREPKGTYLGREAAGRLKAGSTAHAVDLFERALKADPDSASARAGLCEALLLHAAALVERFELEEARNASERLAALGSSEEGVRGLRERIREGQEAGERLAARAQELSDREDHAGALIALDALRLRRPSGDPHVRRALAATHIELGNALVAKGDLRGALDHFRAAHSFGAGERVEEALFHLRPLAVLEAIRAGETEEALRLVDSMTTTYPDAAVPIFLRAALDHVTGRTSEAISGYADAARAAERSRAGTRGLSYEIVRDLSAAVLRSAVMRPPQEGATRWRDTFLTPLREDASAVHFVVYAPTERMARDLGREADTIFATIARDLMGSVPGPLPMEIVVHASRHAYIAADQIPAQSPWASVVLAREKTAGVCYDTLDAKGEAIVRIETHAELAGLLTDTLPHEIAHAVQRRGVPVYRRAHWLDEAVAMRYESARARTQRIANTRQAPALVPLPELLGLRSTPPDRSGIFYDQSCALAEFLRSRGEADWRRFLSAFAVKEFDVALREAFGIVTVEDLEREFLRWLPR